MKKFLLVIIACMYSLIVTASFSHDNIVLVDSNTINIKQTKSNCLSAATPFSIKQKQLKFKRKNLFKKLVAFCTNHNLFKITNYKKTDFSLAGLLLGVLLAPIGVAIAYIATKNKKIRKWAVVGCVTDIGLAMLLIFVLIFTVTF